MLGRGVGAKEWAASGRHIDALVGGVMTRIRPRSWSRSGWVLPSRTLARIAIAIGTLRSGEDAFDALRGASFDDMTAKFSELAGHPGQLREALRLPAPQTTHDLPADQRKALLKAAEIIAACWHDAPRLSPHPANHRRRTSGRWCLRRRPR